MTNGGLCPCLSCEWAKVVRTHISNVMGRFLKKPKMFVTVFKVVLWKFGTSSHVTHTGIIFKSRHYVLIPEFTKIPSYHPSLVIVIQVVLDSLTK